MLEREQEYMKKSKGESIIEPDTFKMPIAPAKKRDQKAEEKDADELKSKIKEYQVWNHSPNIFS